jgi:LuxR family maltose regulon positive regulatory protein
VEKTCDEAESSPVKVPDNWEVYTGGKRPFHDGSPEHVNTLLFLADSHRRQGKRQACLSTLQTAFAGARCIGFPCLSCPPEMMVRLCAEALEAGIENDYVEALIRQHKLLPDGPDTLHWPWPVRIYTLGRFSLVQDGQPLTFTGKSPRKALELLQALIALGGRAVHTSVLTRSVWPDETSTDLRNLFDNTLYRLRRLLGHKDTLLLSDAKLTLDSQHCWVDAWAFERLSGLSGPASPEGGATAVLLWDKRAEAAFKLYQGHFLEREEEASWSVGYRDRLRSRFQRLVRTLGERFEKAGHWLAAAEVYERGIEVDNLAESLYQRLMICHQQRGEHAEAARVYRRCRELLSIVVGIAPSATTDAIRHGPGLGQALIACRGAEIFNL